ncbi:MAG TPA: hypothetical protein VFM65_03975 [Flavobacteriaceae bacterium]|nr:hypothetical protein [Flavobacteriaceae bacterium]
MNVEIFKTNVTDQNLANLLIVYLQKNIPDCLINFDLEDKDNVLRISGNREVSGLVISVLRENGIDCKLL